MTGGPCLGQQLRGEAMKGANLGQCGVRQRARQPVPQLPRRAARERQQEDFRGSDPLGEQRHAAGGDDARLPRAGDRLEQQIGAAVSDGFPLARGELVGNRYAQNHEPVRGEVVIPKGYAIAVPDAWQTARRRSPIRTEGTPGGPSNGKPRSGAAGRP